MLLLSFPYRHRPHRHQTPSRLALKRDGPGTLQISKTINMFNKRSSFRRVAPFKEFGFRNPGNFCLRNPESCALESGIKRKEYGIPVRNTFPLTMTGIKYLESRTYGVESKIQDFLGSPYMGREKSSKAKFRCNCLELRCFQRLTLFTLKQTLAARQ